MNNNTDNNSWNPEFIDTTNDYEEIPFPLSRAIIYKDWMKNKPIIFTNFSARKPTNSFVGVCQS